MAVFITTENKLISFRQQIIPFWSEFCKNSQREKLTEIFDELKQKTEESILKKEIGGDTVNWLNGGINTSKMEEKKTIAKKLYDDLRVFKLRFEIMANNEPLEQKL